MTGHDDTPPEGGAEYPVNGQRLTFDDTKVTGRQVLTAGGFTPASEHQLILVFKGRTHLVQDDDDVDLSAKAGGHLRAFRSDRLFTFSVNEVSQVWALTAFAPPYDHCFATMTSKCTGSCNVFATGDHSTA